MCFQFLAYGRGGGSLGPRESLSDVVRNSSTVFQSGRTAPHRTPLNTRRPQCSASLPILLLIIIFKSLVYWRWDVVSMVILNCIFLFLFPVKPGRPARHVPRAVGAELHSFMTGDVLPFTHSLDVHLSSLEKCLSGVLPAFSRFVSLLSRGSAPCVFGSEPLVRHVIRK